MTHSRWILAMAAALSVSAACADDPTGGSQGAGTVVLRLTTPYADDGALLFEVSGPPVENATASDGSLQLFTRHTGSSQVVGAVVGAIANGVLVTLQVEGANTATEYTARVLEVADRQNALRASLAGYALSVETKH